MYLQYVSHTLRQNRGIFSFFMYFIQHCFIGRSSESTLSDDAGIEPRTVATLALSMRRSNHSARTHPLYMWTSLGKQR
jgi:hypothetical protein